jgi:hypothetical protein
MPISEQAVRFIRDLPSLLQFPESYQNLNRSSPVRILCSDNDIRGVEGHDRRLAS